MVPPPAFLPLSLSQVVNTALRQQKGRSASTRVAPLQSVLVEIADKGEIELRLTNTDTHFSVSPAGKSTTCNREGRQTAEFIYRLLVIQAQNTEVK